jgi:hypothetical protein
MKKVLIIFGALLLAPLSASASSVVIESGSGSSIVEFSVAGIPQVALDNLHSGSAGGTSYSEYFSLTSTSGVTYGLNGHLDETGNTTANTKGFVFMSDANPNHAEKEIPPGTYTLKVKVIKFTPGTPSYVLNQSVVFEESSDYFSWPLTKKTSDGTATPSCTLTASPSTASIGDMVTVSWTSTNAKKLSWIKDKSGKDNLAPPKGKVKKKGSKKIKMTVEGNPFLTLQVTGSKKQKATCSVIIPVTSAN